MSKEMLNVILEVLNDSCVGIEFLHYRIYYAVARSGDVDTPELQEGVFASLVIVLQSSAH